MKTFNKKHILYICIATLLVTTTGIAYAAFSDKGKVLGSKFSIGSGDIKLLKDLALGSDPTNLADEMAGPTFENIGSSWQKDYAIKIYNNATNKMALSTNANYETANDPAELRSVIYVEPFAWNDADSDGVVDTNELGSSLGTRKNLTKWKTEGFSLGQVDMGTIKSFVLHFSTDTISETKQGTSGIFDFEFSAVEVN